MAHNCEINKRYQNLEVFIEGLIFDGDYHLKYLACDQPVEYRKKKDTHIFKVGKNRTRFLLKRDFPRAGVKSK